jgi:hypothetical protein
MLARSPQTLQKAPYGSHPNICRGRECVYAPFSNKLADPKITWSAPTFSTVTSGIFTWLPITHGRESPYVIESKWNVSIFAYGYQAR